MIRRGTLSGHFVEHIEGLVKRMARAAEALPTPDLVAQRDDLRASCKEPASPEALVLKMLSAEMRRREARK